MPPHLTTLPPELHLEIILYLPTPSLASLSQTCHGLHTNLTQPLHNILLRDKFLPQPIQDPENGETKIGNTLQWAAFHNRLRLVSDLLNSGVWDADEIPQRQILYDPRIPEDWYDSRSFVAVCGVSPLVLALNSGDEADVVVRMLLGKGAAVTKAEAMEKRWDFEPCAWEVKGLSFMMEGILANEALRRAEGVDSEDEVEAVETGNGDESEESSSESSWV